VKIRAVSRQDYDDAVAGLDQAKAAILVAEAAVKTARINLEYTKVYAPIGGRIGKSSVTEGALVTANQSTSLATITQLDPIYVDLSQSSSDLMRLRDAVSAGLVQQG
jgi:multidrug efflux pump subunit AcrA (membrane-fusion protein)